MSRTCRTCLFKENEAIVTFYSLDFIDLKCSKSVKEMLTVCVPELALDIVSNSVLCSSCANSLESLYEFKTKCLQTERTITSYLQQIPNSSCINLNEISEALLKSNATYSVDNVALSSKTDCKKSESTFEEIHELQSTIKTEELDFDCKDDLNTGYMSNSEGEDTSYDDSKDVKPDLGFHSVFMQISDAQSKCQSDASNLGASRGRPSKSISREQLQHGRTFGYTAKQMADLFQCSKSTVYDRIRKEDIGFRPRYTPISDEELKIKVEQLHQQYPDCGAVMMNVHLLAAGIYVTRSRIRKTLGMIDPVGTAKRRTRIIRR